MFNHKPMAIIGRSKMSVLTVECEKTIDSVRDLLLRNPEWRERYERYASQLHNNSTRIKDFKAMFREWAPLYVYMNVAEAKSRMVFSLRYQGQDVARLKVGPKKITLSTQGFNGKNKRDFQCPVELDQVEWRSKIAREFRRHFSMHPKRTASSGKGNEEHRIESMLLTEFSKKKSIAKLFRNIQPVRLAGITRFQMPTPLSASSINGRRYSAAGGGGIDILSRTGSGKGTRLCVMEVKDENKAKEPAAKAIIQGLVYATFIRELLRSECGSEWWKIFGYKGKLPQQLKINVACVMPGIPQNDTSFAGMVIPVEGDEYHLHYMYFTESYTAGISTFETSL
jgi:hypothetical protein